MSGPETARPRRALGRVLDEDGTPCTFLIAGGETLILDAPDVAAAAALAADERALRALVMRPLAGGLAGSLLPPLTGCRKIVALGRSFAEHAIELGNAAPVEPIVFSKLPENAVGHLGRVPIPSGAGVRCDNEVELGVLIGRELRAASDDEAFAAIAGWTVSNDVTWRSEQFRARDAGEPWFLAKNLPGAHPIGPWIVPRDDLPDVSGIAIRCRINGETRQETTMTGLMWGIPRLLAWLSRRVPLRPGDLVSMGTPKGVTTIVPGDVVEAEIGGIGTLTSVIEERSW